MVVLVLSQNKVLQRFAEQILDEKVVRRAQQRFEEQDLEVPRVSLVQSCVGLVAPFSDMDKLLALSHGNLDIISTSCMAVFMAARRSFCLRQSTEALGRISHVHPREGVLGSRGRFAVALENLDFQRAPCI